MPAALTKSPRRVAVLAAVLLIGALAREGRGEAPGGVAVWNADALTRVAADGQPGGPLGPLQLVAPRNGVASGQVVVSAPAALPGLSAQVSDLKSAQGETIPASAIRVRYSQVSKGFMALGDAPVAGQKVQPVWLTVKAPATAAPGQYTGRLTLQGLGRPVSVPVELTVCAWKVGDPREWRTWVNLLQSPESVAGYYKVPRWSDRHFQLMEKSFELMGLAGNDILGVSAIAKTVFGDDPVIVFRKDGAQYVPVFTYLERYLAAYHRHASEPRFLALQVWDYNMYRSGRTRDGGDKEWSADTINVQELRDGQLIAATLPMYGQPGSEELWRQVLAGLREQMKKLGWTQTRLLLGTSGDNWIGPLTVEFFRKIAPDAQWRALTHGGGCPKWGATDLARTQPNGMVVGCLEIARRLTNGREYLPDHPVTCNSRDHVSSHPASLRFLPGVTVITCNYDGICWKGMDYWTYTTPQGGQRSALNTYLAFGNMVGGTPRALTAPGPDGAVATVQYEMLREGLQECEAMVSMRENLKALYPPPLRKCDGVELFLENGLCREGGRSDAELGLALYFHEGGIVVRPSAPTYNTGRHDGDAVTLPNPDGETYKVQVRLGDDAWVKGGSGTYTIQLKRNGNAYAGTYTGVYNGKERKGAVKGEYRSGAVSLPSAQPVEKSDLAQRGEAATEALLKRLENAEKAGGDLTPLVLRLYGMAAEVEGALAAKPPKP